jgi:hypothetical protein
MIKLLLAGVAGVILISGVAFADQYPPAPPPSMPLAPPPVGTSPAETTPPGVAPGPEITKKYIHRKGVAGSTETHKTTVTPDGGTTTTRSKSTTRSNQ